MVNRSERIFTSQQCCCWLLVVHSFEFKNRAISILYCPHYSIVKCSLLSKYIYFGPISLAHTFQHFNSLSNRINEFKWIILIVESVLVQFDFYKRFPVVFFFFFLTVKQAKVNNVLNTNTKWENGRKNAGNSNSISMLLFFGSIL